MIAARRALLAAALLGPALSFAACTPVETDEQKKYVWDPYTGDPAYPNRRPKFTLPAGAVGLTSDNGSDTVTLLDLTANTVIGAAPIGRDPVDNDGPHHVALDRAHGFAYVALAYPAPAISLGPHAAHGSSTRAGFVQKLALDDLRVVGEVRVDNNPGDIVMSDDGARVVVSHFDLQKALTSDGGIDDKRATLAVIDPTTLAMSGSPDPVFITTCVAPHGVALSRPDGATAFAACYGEDSIAIVNLGDPTAALVRVPVGAGAATTPGAPNYGPYSAVLSPTGDKLAIGNTESKDVRFLDVASQAMDALVINTLGAPYFPAWAADGAKLFIPTQTPDAVVVADAITGDVLGGRTFTKAECTSPHEIDLGTGGAMIYVVCEGDHVAPSVVLALDPDTLETKATMNVGVYPDRLSIAGAP